MRRVLAVVLCLAVAGCAANGTHLRSADPEVPAELTSGEPVCRNSSRGNTLHGCNHPSGVAVEIRQTAASSYLYAQLAENAYDRTSEKPDSESDPSRPFVLPSNVRELEQYRRPRDDEGALRGFAAKVYEIRETDSSSTIALVFRGTEFTHKNDWIFGNFSDGQARIAQRMFQDIRSAHPDAKMVVAGHSLGGAIAAYISLNEEDVDAYMFNTSVRVRRGKAHSNARYAISQYGEILVALRRLWINPGGTYTVVNCNGTRFFGPHGMRPLAECLTNIAAWVPGSGAEESLVANGLGVRTPLFEPEVAVSTP